MAGGAASKNITTPYSNWGKGSWGAACSRRCMSLPNQATGRDAAGGSPNRTSSPSATSTAAPSSGASRLLDLCLLSLILALNPFLRLDTGPIRMLDLDHL